MNDNIFGVYMLAVAIISVTTESYIWGVLASVGGVIGVNIMVATRHYEEYVKAAVKAATK